MLINEIFSSIDGEAKRAGELATFVRSVGCNLRCDYCDSKYTWEKSPSNREMSVAEIVAECEKFGNHNITFTGGEPLLQKDSDELIMALAEKGFDVCIETNGAVDFTQRRWFQSDYEFNQNIWVCADYKGLASKETSKMLPIEKFSALRERDVLKFVVGSQLDLEIALGIVNSLREYPYYNKCFIYLSPVFGEIEPVEIVEFMKAHNMQNKIRFQLQIHKIVWDPLMTGV